MQYSSHALSTSFPRGRFPSHTIRLRPRYRAALERISYDPQETKIAHQYSLRHLVLDPRHRICYPGYKRPAHPCARCWEGTVRFSFRHPAKQYSNNNNNNIFLSLPNRASAPFCNLTSQRRRAAREHTQPFMAPAPFYGGSFSDITLYPLRITACTAQPHMAQRKADPATDLYL